MKSKKDIEDMLKFKEHFLYGERVEDLKPWNSEIDSKTKGWVEALEWVLK